MIEKLRYNWNKKQQQQKEEKSIIYDWIELVFCSVLSFPPKLDYIHTSEV